MLLDKCMEEKCRNFIDFKPEGLKDRPAEALMLRQPIPNQQLEVNEQKQDDYSKGITYPQPAVKNVLRI